MISSKKLVLVSLSSPHIRTFYELIKPLFDDILIISDENQDFCKTEVVDFRISRPISALKNLNKIRRIVISYNPSIVHIHQANSVALITGKAISKKYPIVLTTWGSDVLVLPKQNLIKKRIAVKALQYANAVTADAAFMENSIIELAPQSKVVIANFGIELGDVLTETEINNKKNIIYSNRLHYSIYNIKSIIEGFYEFLKTNPNWKLIIAGRGDLTDDLKEFAGQLLPPSSYDFVGFINKDTNYGYYKTSKIWISVPKSDGTAVSLLEAMHFGCIPVVSNLPANNEWISMEGAIKNGVIVKGLISDAIGVASLLNSSDVYKINSQIIKTRASVESMRRLYQNLYSDLIRTFKR